MEPYSEDRIRLSNGILGLLFFFTFIYPFLLENIRMFESVASYNVVRIIPLPKEVRYFEILFFIILALYVYLNNKHPGNGYMTGKETYKASIMKNNISKYRTSLG